MEVVWGLKDEVRKKDGIIIIIIMNEKISMIKIKLIGDGRGNDDEGYDLRVNNISRLSSTLQ